MKYKELQIIRHALQQYVTRPGAFKNDIVEEKRLLEKVTNKVEEMKVNYGIK